MERRFILKENGLQIPCVLEEPEYCTVRRCIIGVHGICGSKDSQVLEDIAEEMGLFGAATVRFDLPAHGDSPETDCELSLQRCQDALTAVAQWAHSVYPFVDLCIFATGFGAVVTLSALYELRMIHDPLKVVLQTPNLNMNDSLLNMGRVTEAEFREAGRITVGGATMRKVVVPYSFYQEVGQELEDNIIYYNHGVPMLLLHGELDDMVPYHHLESLRRFNGKSKLVVIPGADHQFRGRGQWDMVVDLTRDWFEFEQVLLCDWI